MHDWYGSNDVAQMIWLKWYGSGEMTQIIGYGSNDIARIILFALMSIIVIDVWIYFATVGMSAWLTKAEIPKANTWTPMHYWESHQWLMHYWLLLYSAQCISDYIWFLYDQCITDHYINDQCITDYTYHFNDQWRFTYISNMSSCIQLIVDKCRWEQGPA